MDTCSKHPLYTGRRSPRTDCGGCWKAYKANNKNENNENKSSKEEIKQESFATRNKETSLPENTKDNNNGHGALVESGEQRKLNKEEVSKLLNDHFDEVINKILPKKLEEARKMIDKELYVQWEHFFLYEQNISMENIQKLEKEGWQFMTYSYPLAKNGIIPGGKDYYMFKRPVRKENLPIPNFEENKTGQQRKEKK